MTHLERIAGNIFHQISNIDEEQVYCRKKTLVQNLVTTSYYVNLVLSG